VETNPEQLAAASAQAEISLVLLHVLNLPTWNYLFLSLDIYTQRFLKLILINETTVAFPMIMIFWTYILCTFLVRGLC
jgi:hypothetical protein